MPYVTIREIRCVDNIRDSILIENPFKETTRSGKLVLRLVQIGKFLNLFKHTLFNILHNFIKLLTFASDFTRVNVNFVNVPKGSISLVWK